MSRWKDEFSKHQLHETLQALRESASTEFKELSEGDLVERRRFLKAISEFEGALRQVDPELALKDQLDALNNSLRHQNVWSQLQSYKSNGDANHLKTANDHVNQSLAPLAMLKAIASPVSGRQPLDQLESLVDDFATAVEKKKDQFKSELDSVTSDVSSQHAELTELKNLVETRRTETESQLATWQQQFSAAQEQRSKEFSTSRKKFEDDARNSTEKVTATSSKEFQDLISKHKEQITSTLDDAEAKHQRILELYELTAGDSVAAGYLQSAQDEKYQADLWRWICVAFILGTASWLLVAYVFNPSAAGISDVVWSKLIVTFSLTGVLLYGAAYSANQSTKHRNAEKRTRWFALEIKALDPFISSLNEEQQGELKKSLTDRLFGKSENHMADGAKVVDEHAFKIIGDFAAKLVSLASKR